MPATARAARATRDFFIASFSKVKHRAPVRRVHRDWHLVLPPDPGPTSFWEVVAIASEAFLSGRVIHAMSNLDYAKSTSTNWSGVVVLRHGIQPVIARRMTA